MKQKTFNAAAEAFSRALADLIEHPETPDRVYQILCNLTSELSADLSPIWTPADEAEAVRRNFPSLLTLAARAQSLGVSHDEL